MMSLSSIDQSLEIPCMTSSEKIFSFRKGNRELAGGEDAWNFYAFAPKRHKCSHLICTYPTGWPFKFIIRKSSFNRH